MSNEAQAGISRILRPQSNFETLYTGEPADTQPIYLFPDGQPRDELAGTPGYDANLVRALTVPMGAQVQIWVPILSFIAETDPDIIFYSYKWTFIWRLRNPVDFKRARKPFHNRQGEGATDSSSGTAERRVVIPAGFRSLIYPNAVTPTSTAPDATRGVTNGRVEESIFAGTVHAGPILEAGVEGAIQQGLHDPVSVAGATRPEFMCFRLLAEGDELLIAINRDPHQAPNWGFETAGDFPTNADAIFARFFSNVNTGVYVFAETSDGFGTPRSPLS